MRFPTKPELRIRALAQRRAEAPKHPGAAEAAAKAALAGLAFGRADVVAGYVAMRDEIEVLPLLKGLASLGIATALPCVVEGRTLVFRAWRPGDGLRPAPHDTQEPAPDAPLVRPTIVFVPLLAFDSEGYRLGYGGGYYDRALAALKAGGGSRAIGLAFAFQRVERLPREAHDHPLEAVVTERGVTGFAS